MTIYVCTQDYWDDSKQQFTYMKGGLYMFEEPPFLVSFDEYFEPAQGLVDDNH